VCLVCLVSLVCLSFLSLLGCAGVPRVQGGSPAAAPASAARGVPPGSATQRLVHYVLTGLTARFEGTGGDPQLPAITAQGHSFQDVLVSLQAPSLEVP